MTTTATTLSDRPVWGEGVRLLRSIYGFTVEQVAFLAWTDAETIGRIEAGDRQITPELRKRIAAAFHTDATALFWEGSSERQLRLV
jgi:transcriptional regulator with XRE-family HTH domain